MAVHLVVMSLEIVVIGIDVFTARAVEQVIILQTILTQCYSWNICKENETLVETWWEK